MLSRQPDLEKLVCVNENLFNLHGTFVVEWVEQPVDAFMFCREPFTDVGAALAFMALLKKSLADKNLEMGRAREMADDGLRYEAEKERAEVPA